MAPPATTTSLVFSTGPLGFELEPRSEANGRAVGCRVVRFKRGDDGGVGQAQRIGGVRPGDILTQIDAVPLGDMPFDKIIAMLRRNSSRTDRRLTFDSSGPTQKTMATTATVAQTSTPVSNASEGRKQPLSAPAQTDGRKQLTKTTTTSTGGSTQPATPSPESQTRPASESVTRFVEEPKGLVGEGGEDQLQRRRLGWAMGLLGLGGARAGEADCAIDSEAAGPRQGGSVIAGDSRGDDGAGGRPWWTGVPEVGCGKGLEGGDTDSGTDDNSAITAGAFSGAEHPSSGNHFAVAPAATAECDTVSIPRTPGASTKASGTLTRDEGWPQTSLEASSSSVSHAPGSIPTVLPSEQPQTQSAQITTTKFAPSRVLMTTASLDGGGEGSGGGGDDGVAVRSPTAVPQVTIRTTTLTRRPDRDRGHNINIYNESGERPSRASSPETAGLDTVSLVSEPAASVKEASSKLRTSIMSGLWGGGGGGEREGVGPGPDASRPEPEGEDGEAEGARRLARSLAVKLKERARRCEELEDLFGLRDHQVSMLQRQSNSLAVRAAALADELTDKSALVEALQRDRSRLERELAQSRSQSLADEGERNGDVADQSSETPTAAEASEGSGCGGVRLPLPGSAGGDVPGETRAAGRGAAPAMEAALAAGKSAAAVEEAESKARVAVAAAEARSLTLQEMVDSLVSEKVGWEEERASGAAEALRLRARVRGLEEALVDRGDAGGGERDGGAGGSRKLELVVVGVRKLLRERTRELEVKGVATDRLAEHARVLEDENRRLRVSISAREEDLLVSDRQMHVLTARLKGDARASGEAAAAAEAVVEQLRRALEQATAAGAAAAVGASGSSGCGAENKAGDSIPGEQAESGAGGGSGEEVAESPTSLEDRISWAEERARLHHNLLSLRQALRDREGQADTEKAALSLRLKAAQDDRDRASRDRVSLREEADTLRVELAEALVLAAGKVGSEGGVPVGEDGVRGARALALREAAAAGDEVADGSVAEGGAVGVGDEDGEQSEKIGGALGVEGAEEDTERPPKKEAEPATGKVDARDKHSGAQDDGGENSKATVEGRTEKADKDCGKRRSDLDGGGGGNDTTAAAAGVRGGWPDSMFEGTIDDVQLDLMEKDIVIEQLRAQLKQLRSRMAMMEEEQAADTAPLQGLLTQLGELKGSVEEGQEREQQCRDQVDMGLLRMERLKEESAAATAATVASSPPGSLAGPTSASPPAVLTRVCTVIMLFFLPRPTVEDLQWDLRTLKRRIEERDNQLRDSRNEMEGLKTRCRAAERDLGDLQSERAMAMAEAADGRDRVSSAVAAVEAAAEERAEALSASLRATTAERDRLLAAERAGHASTAAAAAAAGRSAASGAEDGAARAREMESMRCALASRDVELEAIVDATAGFGHHVDGLEMGKRGSGGGALRGALAAATEARRAGRVVAELKEELSSLKVKVREERADAHRVREALEQAKLAEEKVTAALAASAAAAADRSSPRDSQGNHPADEEGGYSAMKKRAQEAEDFLEKALAGAQRAFAVVASCLTDESKLDDTDLFGTATTTAASAVNTAARPPLLPHFTASVLPSLVAGVEALASAYRDRGHALRRAAVTVRAKTVCAREARRREETEARARGDAETRLEEALVALDNCRQLHLQQQQQQQEQAARWGVLHAGRRVAGIPGPGGVSGGARSALSHEQEEHLRRIRSEVDRLESQNQTLRRSLEGGETNRRFFGKTSKIPSRNTERGVGAGLKGDGNGGMPTRRLLFPPSSAAGDVSVEQAGQRSISHADCWERAEASSESSGRVSPGTPTMSPGRSWAARGDRDGSGQNDEGGEDDARARVLEECAGYCVPPQEDGSGGTLVQAWGRHI
ncbi:unnamed protein product [Scytosiphon promiscuus]